MGKLVALVLAGGRGNRMGVLCETRPKPALPFAGKFRVIDFTLSNCLHSGINDIAVLIDYQRSSIETYLSKWSQSNAVKNLHVLEPKTGSYKGTADAVYQNLDFLDKYDAENVLILTGDHIYRMDYREMLDFHNKVEADVTVSVIKVPMEEVYRFGTVSVDSGNKVSAFVEKSRMPLSNLASMGIYVFNRQALSRRLKEDALRRHSLHDFGYTILPSMAKLDRVYAYEYSGYWQDIGTPQSYYAANMELASEKPSFTLNSSRPVLTQLPELPPPRISPQATVINSLVSPGCVIKGRVENSILSPGVWVEETAVVKNSVLLAKVLVGYHSVVERSVLDEGVSIGKFCYIGFGNSRLPVNEEITIIGEGVSIPPSTAIGRNCQIMPHVGIADFSTNMVPPGSAVSACSPANVA